MNKKNNCAKLASKQRKTVYAYVVADVLHIGHLKHLQKAKQYGDYLIVGVLTDKATMEKKPAPIISFAERVEIVRALKIVDEIVIQDTYSPLSNVQRLKPDILMESDSHDEQLANKVVLDYGGTVIVTPYYHSQSSTKIKDKILGKWRKSTQNYTMSLAKGGQL